MNWDVAWPAAPFAARCGRPVGRGELPHDAPQFDCDCGIYVLKERAEAERLVRDALAPLLALDHPLVYSDDATTFAVGRVSIWGRVIEAAHGYRAQLAYPYELVLLDGTAAQARALRDRYAVDVVAEPVPLEWREWARAEDRKRDAERRRRLPTELVSIPVRL